MTNDAALRRDPPAAEVPAAPPPSALVLPAPWRPGEAKGDRTLSVIVHAAAKAGKSTLTSTAPPPICVLDVEGSWKFIRTAGYRSGIAMRRRTWDPLTELPPRYDGSWDFCHVLVKDWDTLRMVYKQLAEQPHDFRSVVVDSVTEAQRRLKAKLRGLDKMQLQDWGDLLVHMDKLIRDIRDLTLLPSNPIVLVVFVAETELKNGKWRPAMQGAIGTGMPYWVDAVTYLYHVKEADANGQNTLRRQQLLISGNDQIECGERVQGALPEVLSDPNLTTILRMVYGEDTPEGETPRG